MKKLLFGLSITAMLFLSNVAVADNAINNISMDEPFITIYNYDAIALNDEATKGEVAVAAKEQDHDTYAASEACANCHKSRPSVIGMYNTYEDINDKDNAFVAYRSFYKRWPDR